MENEKIEFMQAVKVTKTCEKCGGDMIFGGIVLTTYPGQYPHNCKDCGNEQTYDRTYPSIQYRSAGGSSAV